MIPLRIKVKGFLSYRDEQEIHFGGENNLWILSGPNGSGKSAIFDALTYAIFGHHRGGGQQVQELINKDSDGLLVEFDFELAQKTYRIKRTVRRKSNNSSTSTQQILLWQADRDSFIPISGTENKREGFDPWIRDQIGLTYETFTSSVLLLQGKAEKLLDSKPEGRREVLASIVDLARYERLHRLADDRRKSLDSEQKLLQTQLDSLAEISAESFLNAQTLIERAHREREQARGRREHLQSLEFQARNWQETDRQRNLTSARLLKAQQLLGNAATIQQNLNRFQELHVVLPRLETIASLHKQIHNAQQQVHTLKAARDVGQVEVKKIQGQFDRLLHKQATVRQVIQAEEQRQQDISQRLQQSTAQMGQLQEYEEQLKQQEMIQGQLRQVSSDPVADTKQKRAVVDHLNELAQTLPVLTRLHSRREALRQSIDKIDQAKQSLKDLTHQGEQKSREVEESKSKLDTANKIVLKANEEVTALRTRVKHAEESLADLQILDGSSKVCRACGQAITADHLVDENRRRRADLIAAEKKLEPALQRLKNDRLSEEHLQEIHLKLVAELQVLRNQYLEKNSECKQLQTELNRLQRECSEGFVELPMSYQLKIAVEPPRDWLATVYPCEDELQLLGAQISQLIPARALLAQAEKSQRDWESLKAQELLIQQGLSRLQQQLPAKPELVRHGHQTLNLENQGLLKSIKANREQLANLDQENRDLTQEMEKTRGQIDHAVDSLREQELIIRHAVDAVGSTQKLLPSQWLEPSKTVGIRELAAWKEEFDDLQNQGIEKRGQELLEARSNLDFLQKEFERIDQELLRFEPEARVPPERIQEQIPPARQIEILREKEWMEASQELIRLETQQKQRDTLKQQILAKDADRNVQKLLADLLGKDRLQLYLVRNAERRIVEYANSVLDRLSGGQLCLRLSGEADGEGSSARALDLEAYNRITGDKPINVAYLSGSQKFRVAVSLALGIGQFASQQNRPMESVVIDEGFGCLDQQGRQVMIQELQNLRGHLRCILLVSHQEEFADAFSQGYQFELVNGATRIQRIQK